MVTVSLAEVAPAAVDWFWPSRLAFGTLGLLEGDPELGKSTLTLDLAARLTTGRPMPGSDYRNAPAQVVLLSSEDDMAKTVRPRLEAAGADLTRVFAFTEVVCGGETWLPSFPQDVDRLEALIRDHQARLVVIDPLVAFLDRSVDPNRDRDVRRVLYRLKRVAEATGAVLLLLRHLNKAGSVQALYRGGGSIGITAAVRCGLLAGRDPDLADGLDTFVLVVHKNNLCPRPPALRYRLVDRDGVPVIEWLGPVNCEPERLLGAMPSTHEQAIDQAVDFLERELAGGPVPAGELKPKALALGYNWSTVQRAKQLLGVLVSTPTHFKGPWTWELPARPASATSESKRPKAKLVLPPAGPGAPSRPSTPFPDSRPVLSPTPARK